METPDAISLSDVRKRFGKVHALEGLSLRARQGEIYGLLGRNGAGKSTTMRILMGIASADAGEVIVLGERVKRVPVSLKRRIGYVSQEQNFYPWMTALDLGRFVSAFYPRWSQSEFLGLLQSLDVPPSRRAAELSGGTRTKLGLALALAPRPELLLLDEPTTGLDPVARAEFNDQLVAIVRERGTTALLSSHLVTEVEQIAHRVGIVTAGRMRVEGELNSLTAQVRRVRVVGDVTMPEAFERVRGNVWKAAPEFWATLPLPPSAVVETLSLEEIFLSLARTDAVRDSA